MADLQAPAAPGPGGRGRCRCLPELQPCRHGCRAARAGATQGRRPPDLPRPRPARRRPGLAPGPGAGHRAFRRRRRLPRPHRARHLAAARGPARPRPPGRGGAAGAPPSRSSPSSWPATPTRPAASSASTPGSTSAPIPTTRPSSSSSWPASAARPPPGPRTLREAICPYRGLLAFREEDAGLFFGRDAATERASSAKVRGEPLVTLVGRSGSGKSSVVQAGLIPQLRRRADGRTWAIHTLRPGPEPLHTLVRTFMPQLAD